MDHTHIRNLLEQQAAGTLTNEQWNELETLITAPTQQKVIQEVFEDVMKTTTADFTTDEHKWEYVLENILTIDKKQPPVSRIYFLKAAWIKYAAIAILFLGAAAYLWTANKTSPTLISGNKHLPTEITAGSNKATLTLSDGTSITLDNAATGNIAKQGNATIVKLNNGQVVYSLKGLPNGEILMNTMSTPKGGQYQLVLPDGTKVWLNAASSITYPAVFVGKQRNIRVKGEAYFEVATNKTKPFIVDIDGRSSIEVLGTSFNVDSYEDENTIKATLLEGSIKVSPQLQQAVILHPGQQAQIASDPLRQTQQRVQIINAVNIKQVMAWKNGFFNFNNEDLATIMKQLERWYNIQVKYEGQVPEIKLQGGMDRTVNLSEVLRLFTKLGIKNKLVGTTLIIIGD